MNDRQAMAKSNQNLSEIAKINRLRGGRAPRVLDLFAGCGGLSLGFQAVGCEISAAVELDPHAACSHGENFHRNDLRHSVAFDITKIAPETLCSHLGLGPVDDAIDIVVGGPPCQAFARVGRAKLRGIDAHPEAFLHDPRVQLYKSYIEYVETFRPLAILMENVPDMLNHGGQNIAEQICSVLKRIGYNCRYTLLNSVYYGVPQIRERMFLVGYHRSLGDVEPAFPEPTRKHVLPLGYDGSRAVALKLLNGVVGGAQDYVPPPAANKEASGAVTAIEAIGDLPRIDARKEMREGRLRRGARRFDRPTMEYDLEAPVSEFAGAMREWIGFTAPEEGLYDHQIRYLPRDYELFAEMREGAEYPELYALAVARFEREAKKQRCREGGPDWEDLKAKMVPPYDPGKFPNKWWKLRRDQPVRTLMAHLGKDGYSHIHYDGNQARTISVREAARLQSFPDGFRFSGTMNPAFRQIGNAVPPLMAKALACKIRETLASMLVRTSTVSGIRVAAE